MSQRQRAARELRLANAPNPFTRHQRATRAGPPLLSGTGFEPGNAV